MGKDPFAYLDTFTSAETDVTGTNSGNMLFAQSVYKTLSVPDVTIDRHGYSAKASRADQINESCDTLVLPMANAFRNGWASTLEAYCEFLEALKIPVVVVGIGAQTDLNYTLDKLAPINGLVKRFVSAVLDRSASIGVRGACTASYLKSLGFSEDKVDIIGCPSLFMYGRNFPVRTDVSSLNQNSKISINITSPYKKGTFREGLDLMLRIADAHIRKYPNSILVGQEGRSLSTMVWGKASKGGTEFDGVSQEAMTQLRDHGRAKFFVDPSTWFDYLRDFDFSFGTRLHGNVSALLAGTPCVMLATDSRTLEIAELFKIPCRRITELDESTDAIALAHEADYSAMLRSHGGLFDNYIRFIKKNGLPSIYDIAGAPERFDDRLAKVQFAAPVEGVSNDPLVEYVFKFKKHHDGLLKKMSKRLAAAEKKLASRKKKKKKKAKKQRVKNSGSPVESGAS